MNDWTTVPRVDVYKNDGVNKQESEVMNDDINQEVSEEKKRLTWQWKAKWYSRVNR